jgi:hypothetical protein
MKQLLKLQEEYGFFVRIYYDSYQIKNSLGLM